MICVGKTIKKFRIDRGLSQKQLADRAGLTASFMSLVENDRRTPSINAIRQIADALHVAEEVILWDAIDVPRDLSEKDRRLCETAKVLVKHWYETRPEQEAPDEHPRSHLDPT